MTAGYVTKWRLDTDTHTLSPFLFVAFPGMESATSLALCGLLAVLAALVIRWRRDPVRRRTFVNVTSLTHSHVWGPDQCDTDSWRTGSPAFVVPGRLQLHLAQQ